MILEDQMRGPINSYLEELSSGDEIDRRNGSYSHHLLNELGDIELQVPRPRHYNGLKVIRAYAAAEYQYLGCGKLIWIPASMCPQA
jgi:transposase-like protein